MSAFIIRSNSYSTCPWSQGGPSVAPTKGFPNQHFYLPDGFRSILLTAFCVAAICSPIPVVSNQGISGGKNLALVESDLTMRHSATGPNRFLENSVAGHLRDYADITAEFFAMIHSVQQRGVR